MRCPVSTRLEQSLQRKFLTAVPRWHVLERYSSPVLLGLCNKYLIPVEEKRYYFPLHTFFLQAHSHSLTVQASFWPLTSPDWRRWAQEQLAQHPYGVIFVLTSRSAGKYYTSNGVNNRNCQWQKCPRNGNVLLPEFFNIVSTAWFRYWKAFISYFVSFLPRKLVTV